MNICTFPVELKGSFISEYAIPQMLTTALIDNCYDGIMFPSTKDYLDVDGHHRFSNHNMNLGLFVPYDPINDINETFLKTFSIFTFDQSYDFSL
jgi:hypothetical protein